MLAISDMHFEVYKFGWLFSEDLRKLTPIKLRFSNLDNYFLGSNKLLESHFYKKIQKQLSDIIVVDSFIVYTTLKLFFQVICPTAIQQHPHYRNIP